MGVNLDKISSILKQFGGSELFVGFQLVEAFERPKCEVADTAAVFTITDVGDDRLKGQWKRQGSHRDRPRYTLVRDSSDPNVPTIHWSKHNQWRAFVDNGRHWWRTTLYINKADQQIVPLKGWVVEKGASPAPTLQNASQLTPSECSVHDSDKNDCGYFGIHMAECLARGCCWAAAQASGEPKSCKGGGGSIPRYGYSESEFSPSYRSARTVHIVDQVVLHVRVEPGSVPAALWHAWLCVGSQGKVVASV